MKKSILTIVLAAMMLVAFTACEQSMPTYKNADYITISQNTPFIAGQTFDANNFDVTVHYTDGSTSVIPGAGVVKVATGWDTGDVAKKGATVSAALTSSLAVSSYAVNVIELDNCEISEVTIDEAKTLEKWVNGAQGTTSTTDFTFDNSYFSVESVTYIYESVSYTDNNPTGFTVSAVLPLADYATVGERTITAVVKNSDGVTVDEIEITCTVIDPDAEGQEADYQLNYKITGTGYLGENLTVQIVKDYVDDTPDAVVNVFSTSGEEKYIVYKGNVVESSAFATTYTTSEVKYTVTDLNDYSKTVTFTIPVGKNYMYEFAASGTNKSTVALKTGTYTNGQSISESILEVKPAYYNNDTSTYTVADTYDISLLESNLPSTGTSATLHYLVTYTSKGVSHTYPGTVSVTGINPAD